MSLFANTFSDLVVSDLLLEDFRNSNDLLNVLMDGSASQLVLAKALAGGTAGGFAKQVIIPLLKQHSLSPTDGYSIITSSAFPTDTDANPDLSSAYPQSGDYPIVFNINKTFVGTHFLPEFHKWTYSAGSILQSAEVRANMQEISDQFETAIIADMTSSGRFESVTGQNGVPFNLDASGTEATLMDDLFQIAGDFNKLNVPRDDRFLCLPATIEPVVIKYASLKSRDFIDAGDASQSDGRWARIGGMQLLFSNNLGSTEGLAFNRAQYAAVMPNGIVVENLRDVNRIGDYMRMYGMFGFGSISEIVTAASGDSPAVNAQRAGSWRLTVTGA